MYAEVNCEAFQYYKQYWLAYTRLQNYFRTPKCEQALVDPNWVANQVAEEYAGIAGDIYTDIAKADLISGVHESPEDEHSNIHLQWGPFHNYSDWGLGNTAPGVGQDGEIDFYNVYGPDRLQLSRFPYAGG